MVRLSLFSLFILTITIGKTLADERTIYGSASAEATNFQQIIGRPARHTAMDKDARH